MSRLAEKVEKTAPVRVPVDVVERLKGLCEPRNIPISNLVGAIAKQWLDRNEEDFKTRFPDLESIIADFD